MQKKELEEAQMHILKCRRISEKTRSGMTPTIGHSEKGKLETVKYESFPGVRE